MISFILNNVIAPNSSLARQYFNCI